MGNNGSVVLAEYTARNRNAEFAGFGVFAAVKRDAEGMEVWRWQVGRSCSARTCVLILHTRVLEE